MNDMGAYVRAVADTLNSIANKLRNLSFDYKAGINKLLEQFKYEIRIPVKGKTVRI